MQVRLSVGLATVESALHAVRSSGLERVALLDLDRSGHHVVWIEQSFQLRLPTPLGLMKESPELQLPDLGACDPCSLIQAAVATELVVGDAAGFERVAHRGKKRFDVARIDTP